MYISFSCQHYPSNIANYKQSICFGVLSTHRPHFDAKAQLETLSECKDLLDVTVDNSQHVSSGLNAKSFRLRFLPFWKSYTYPVATRPPLLMDFFGTFISGLDSPFILIGENVQQVLLAVPQIANAVSTISMVLPLATPPLILIGRHCSWDFSGQLQSVTSLSFKYGRTWLEQRKTLFKLKYLLNPLKSPAKPMSVTPNMLILALIFTEELQRLRTKEGIRMRKYLFESFTFYFRNLAIFYDLYATNTTK